MSRPLEVVVVSTRTGGTIRGLLRSRGKVGLVLTAAQGASVDPNGAVVWHPLDGEVVIPADNVDYWQRALPTDEYIRSVAAERADA